MKTKKTPRDPIGVWYRAEFGWRANITAYPIVTYSDLTVTYLESTNWDGSGAKRERREDKVSQDHKWFASFDEAYAFVTEVFDKKLERAQKQSKEARALRPGNGQEG